MLANSKRACKYCKEFKSYAGMVRVPAGVFCNISEAIKFANEKQVKIANKERKKRHRADKERIKTRAQWLKEAQSAVNKYVRLRDKGRPCISCDKPDNGQHQRHASHYKSVGSNSALRFNLHNIHASCSTCNNHLSGNIGEYIPRLIVKIGQTKYDYLLTQNHAVKHEPDYLKRLKQIFNKRARRIEKGT